MFNKGDTVILNKDGKDCYKRNIVYKSIPDNVVMKIKSHQGSDNGRDIWEVEWKDKTDYYFDYCLELLYMGKVGG